MDEEHRRAVYATVNGQRWSGKLVMTPKQRRRYWKKWFARNYVEPVLLDEAGQELEGLIDASLRRARQDREAPLPVEAWPSWQEKAKPGESFWEYMDRTGVTWG